MKRAAWFGLVTALAVYTLGARIIRAAGELVDDLADATDGPDTGWGDDYDMPQPEPTWFFGTPQVAARVGDVVTRGNINALPLGSIVKRDDGKWTNGIPLVHTTHGFESRDYAHHRDTVVGWGDARIISLGRAA